MVLGVLEGFLSVSFICRARTGTLLTGQCLLFHFLNIAMSYCNLAIKLRHFRQTQDEQRVVFNRTNPNFDSWLQMKSSDAKASKCHLKFSSGMIIFIKLVYISSVISLKWRLIDNLHCHLSEITNLIKIIVLEENFKWHLEAFASELFKYFPVFLYC